MIPDPRLDAQAGGASDRNQERSRRNWQKLATPSFIANLVASALVSLVDDVTIAFDLVLRKIHIKLGGVTPPYIGLVAKGDLITRGSSATAILGVGTSGQALIVDAGQPLGIKWGTPGGGGGGGLDTNTIFLSSGHIFVNGATSTPYNGGLTISSDGTVLATPNTIVLRDGAGLIPGSITGTSAVSILSATSLTSVFATSAGTATLSINSLSSNDGLSGAVGVSPLTLTLVNKQLTGTMTQASGSGSTNGYVTSGQVVSWDAKIGSAVQSIIGGSTGTDFLVSQSGSAVTINLPLASATNIGKVGTTDWVAWTNKIGSGVQSVVGGAAGTDFVVAQAGGAVTIDLPIADATHTGKLNTATFAIFNAKGTGTGTLNNVILTAPVDLTVSGSNSGGTQTIILDRNTNTATFGGRISFAGGTSTALLVGTTLSLSGASTLAGTIAASGVLSATASSGNNANRLIVSTNAAGAQALLAKGISGQSIDIFQVLDSVSNVSFGVGTKTITLRDAVNFKFGTTTGTQIGASTDKIGAYGTTPVVKQTISGLVASGAATASIAACLGTIGWATDSTTGAAIGGTMPTNILTATATLDFPNTLAQTSSDLTITVTGAATGDVVIIGVPNGSVNANSDFFGWVSAANTVTIRLSVYGILAIDPASGVFRASVLQF